MLLLSDSPKVMGEDRGNNGTTQFQETNQAALHLTLPFPLVHSLVFSLLPLLKYENNLK